MKKVLTKVKAVIKKSVENFNENPFYYSLDLAAVSAGLFWGLWAKDKSTKDKVKSIVGSYFTGFLFGFIGFMLDSKLDRKRKAK